MAIPRFAALGFIVNNFRPLLPYGFFPSHFQELPGFRCERGRLKIIAITGSFGSGAPLTGEREVAMKDVYEVLLQKEFDLRRVQTEIEALHVAIPLLADDADHLGHGIVVGATPGQNPTMFGHL